MNQAKDDNNGWIIGLTIFGVFALIIVMGQVAKAANTGPTTTTTTTKGGFGDILSNIVSNAGGWFGSLFGGNKNITDIQKYCKEHPTDIANCNSITDCYNGCKSSMPGYDCNGNPSSNC